MHGEHLLRQVKLVHGEHLQSAVPQKATRGWCGEEQLLVDIYIFGKKMFFLFETKSPLLQKLFVKFNVIKSDRAHGHQESKESSVTRSQTVKSF